MALIISLPVHTCIGFEANASLILGAPFLGSAVYSGTSDDFDSPLDLGLMLKELKLCLVRDFNLINSDNPIL